MLKDIKIFYLSSSHVKRDASKYFAMYILPSSIYRKWSKHDVYLFFIVVQDDFYKLYHIKRHASQIFLSFAFSCLRILSHCKLIVSKTKVSVS
jgi:hypothetical protein